MELDQDPLRSILERAATDVVRKLGLSHRCNVLPHEARSSGLLLPGEVDLLVADPAQGRLWVCEVKDVSMAVSPSTIGTRLVGFLGRKGYVAKLIRKTIAIHEQSAAAADLLGLPRGETRWQAIPLMVTRRVEPAAFVDGIATTFTVVVDLAATLTSTDGPAYGHTPIPES